MIKCTKFKELKKGCLLGFGSIEVEKWGIEIHSCSLNEKNGNVWVGLPSQVYEKDGEKKYAPYITFKNKEHYKKFQEMCIEAMNKKRKEQQLEEPVSQYPVNDEEVPF